jgi:ribosome maturation protein SDO1
LLPCYLLYLQILKKGELQVGEKERSAELTNLWRDIATQVSSRCVDPSNKRPYTVGVIEKAMTEVHYSVKTGKAAKSQALDVIKLLQSNNVLPLERARMRIRLTLPSKEGKRLKDKVIENVEKVEEEDWSEEWELIAEIDPGALRVLNDLLETESKGKGKIETLNFASVQEGEGTND